MEPIYILMKVDAHGRLQASVTNHHELPDDFVQPGEIAFILNPLDVQARHNHEGPTQ
jgi:hypothetical protein